MLLFIYEREVIKMVIFIIILFFIGLYLGLKEEPKMDYTKAWEKLKNEL